MALFDYEEYGNEEAYLDSLKQDDHYHFSIPFEYIETRHGDGDYDIAEAQMEVDVHWNETEHGYSITYYCPEMHKIDPGQGNSGIDEFYDVQIENVVLDKLDSMGIGSTALVGGTGTF